MSRLESVKRTVCRWFSSIPFFVLLGLILGCFISVAVIPKPNIGIISISSPLVEQTYTDNILDMLKYARDNNNIKAVVLQINSPGGSASDIEPIYLEVLRLRQQKPVVASVGTIAASGGYYIAIASNFIYAEPTSLLGSIGAWSSLPHPEELGEDVITSGPFKATGGSGRKALSMLETMKQQFSTAVTSQRGDRLKLSGDELSRAEIYSGTESLRYGLIDAIGTRTTDAIAKAASLAGIRNYGVVKLEIRQPSSWLSLLSMKDLKARTGLTPTYYYLYFESE